jgi:hypothetical protein
MNTWFRCKHKKTSLPVNRRRKDSHDEDGQRRANSYVVCLSCGRQIPYLFREDRVVQDRRKPRTEGAKMPKVHSMA